MVIHSCLFEEEGEAVIVSLLYLEDKWLEAVTHKVTPWSKAFHSQGGFEDTTLICSNIILATNRDRNPLPQLA